MAIARREKKRSKKTLVSCSFSVDKIEAMKQKAREISKMIGENSKTIINQEITPPEMCVNSRHNSKIDNALSINDQISTLMNTEIENNPSNSKISIEKTLPETIISLNEKKTSKRNHRKDLILKHKKSKIPYLVKCDIYQEELLDDLTSKKQDDYVLEKLFNRSGIYVIFKLL